MNTALRYIRIPLLIAICILPFRGEGQKNYLAHNFRRLLHQSESVRHYERAMKISESKDAYLFMFLRSYLGANNAVIARRKDNIIIEYQWKLIENLMKSAEVSKNISNNKSPFKDGYMGWISVSDEETFNKEVPLYESYSFFYIAQFLYYLKENGWRDDSFQNRDRWNKLLSFIEKDIWTKWYQRCISVKGNNYWYFLRGRTHMGSHWAGIAMYLSDVTTNNKIKQQGEYLIGQYDTLLKRNLKVKGKGYVWNSTYDDISGTYASKDRQNIIQDVSHGNHVISYVIAAYQYSNKSWGEEDINRFSYTLKDFVYDKRNNIFRDNVDGSGDYNRPGWGNFVGDGWIKLAEYDDEVRSIFQKFENSKNLKKYNQEIQFKAILYKDAWGT